MAILNSNGLYLDVIEKNDNSTVQNIQGDARILCMDGCSEISLSYPNFQNIKDKNSLKGICVTIINFKNEGSINLIGFTGPQLTLDKGDSINCYWTGNSWINGYGKSLVHLDRVDNTNDREKRVSDATNSALETKQNKIKWSYTSPEFDTPEHENDIVIVLE